MSVQPASKYTPFQFPIWFLLIIISSFCIGLSNSLPFVGNTNTSHTNQMFFPSNPAPSSEPSDSGNDLKKFISFFVFSMICCILNCGTIAVMFQAKRVRRVNYLISNLSVTSILLAVYGCIYVGDDLHVLTSFRGVSLCGILSYSRNVLVSVISLSVFFISYERIRSLKSTMRHLLINRVIFFIWTFSSLTMIPTLFNRVYEHHPPEIPICKKVSPFGWDTFAIVFELLRFVVFHVSVCIYMIFELYEIRSKTKYLYLFKTMPNENMRKKVQRVRFVYIFSISFMLIWLPFGFILCITIIQYRVSLSLLENFPDFTMYLWYTVYFYIMVVPIIILFTNEGISHLILNLNLQCGDAPQNPASNADSTNINGREIKDICTSAIDETFNNTTTTPQADVVSCPNNPFVASGVEDESGEVVSRESIHIVPLNLTD